MSPRGRLSELAPRLTAKRERSAASCPSPLLSAAGAPGLGRAPFLRVPCPSLTAVATQSPLQALESKPALPTRPLPPGLEKRGRAGGVRGGRGVSSPASGAPRPQPAPSGQPLTPSADGPQGADGDGDGEGKEPWGFGTRRQARARAPEPAARQVQSGLYKVGRASFRAPSGPSPDSGLSGGVFTPYLLGDLGQVPKSPASVP